jgi:hypothetical protein
MRLFSQVMRYRGLRESRKYNRHGQTVWEDAQELAGQLAVLEQELEGAHTDLATLILTAPSLAHLLALVKLRRDQKQVG